MKWLALLTLFVSTVTHAAGHPLLNDREGTSSILTNSQIQNLERMSISRAILERDYKDVLASMKGEACAFTLNDALTKKLPNHPVLGIDRDNMLRALRHQGLIDDVALQILLRASGVQKDIKGAPRDAFNPPATTPNDLKPLREFSVRRSKGKCLHENYRDLIAGYRQYNAAFNWSKIKGLIPQAVKLGYLTDKGALELQELAKDGVDSWEISLAEYVTKREFMKNQFRIDETERSNFITKLAPKSKLSHRMRLYSLYSPMQITLMGNIIKKLKARLESPKIEILVYENDETTVEEVITLDPMERFRFAIRLLRKEMKLLSTNNYFAGRAPSYGDLLASSYEIGMVTAYELDQMGELEEIWNPTETFWDKAASWVRMFGGVLTVVVPAPYGFLPALAITAIELVNREAPIDDQDSLF